MSASSRCVLACALVAAFCASSSPRLLWLALSAKAATSASFALHGRQTAGGLEPNPKGDLTGDRVMLIEGSRCSKQWVRCNR